MNLEEDNKAVLDDEMDDEMLPEYDFSNAIQGKHFREYHQGYTVTVHKEDGTVETREYKPEKGVVVLDPILPR